METIMDIHNLIMDICQYLSIEVQYIYIFISDYVSMIKL